MKRSYLLFIPLVLLPSAGYSQSKEGSYYCVTEWAAAGWYNFSTKRWGGGSLNPNAAGIPKFALKLRSIGERTIEQKRPTFLLGHEQANTLEGQEIKIESYIVTIMSQDRGFTLGCSVTHGVDRSPEVSSVSGVLKCNGYPYDYDYVFNVNTNRFIQKSTSAFTDGRDDDRGQPFIAGGTCTKTGD
jgi:hypothetical protein